MTVLAEKYEQLDFEPLATGRARLRLVDPSVTTVPNVAHPVRPGRTVVVRRAGHVRGCVVERRPATWRLTQRGVRVLTLTFGMLLATAVAVIVFEFLAVSNAPLG